MLIFVVYYIYILEITVHRGVFTMDKNSVDMANGIQKKLSDIMARQIKNNLMIIIGCIVYGFGLNMFIKANELALGGFSGLGLILNYKFGFPVGAFFIIANIPLLIISFKVMGQALCFQYCCRRSRQFDNCRSLLRNVARRRGSAAACYIRRAF